MFYNCESLNNAINLNITKSKVKYMEYMFYNLVNLAYLELSEFNLKN